MILVMRPSHLKSSVVSPLKNRFLLTIESELLSLLQQEGAENPVGCHGTAQLRERAKPSVYQAWAPTVDIRHQALLSNKKGRNSFPFKSEK